MQHVHNTFQQVPTCDDTCDDTEDGADSDDDKELGTYLGDEECEDEEADGEENNDVAEDGRGTKSHDVHQYHISKHKFGAA